MSKVNLPVLMNQAPWSPSKVDKAMQCALAFHYRYTDKVKQSSNTYSRIGTAAHRAQELILEGSGATDALKIAVDESTDLTNAEIEKVRMFRDALVGFHKKLERFKHKHGVTKVMLEEKWAITSNFEPCDFFDKTGMVRGVVDLALLTKDGYVIVIDHKSGKKKPVDKFQLQLDTYAVMALAHFPECKGVQPALHFMAHEKILWDSMRERDHITDVLQPWLQQRLTRAGEKVVDRTPGTGWWCGWCDYKSMCPAWDEDGDEIK